MSGQGNGEAVFYNGRVFDGVGFLPVGTAVRVTNGRITDVGPDQALDGAEPIDLGGGTLLPGFIDAHAHPVFAGNQLRHCDLRGGHDRAGYLAPSWPRYARDPPGRAVDHRRRLGDGRLSRAACPTARTAGRAWSRPPGVPAQPGRARRLGQQPRAGAGRHRRGHAGPAGRPDRAGRRRRADRHAAGGRRRRSSRGCSPRSPRTTGTQALLTAQDHLLSLGITGWQDAIIGDYQDDADPLPAYLRAAGTARWRPASSGRCGGTVIGAWTSSSTWLHRRDQAGRAALPSPPASR